MAWRFAGQAAMSAGRPTIGLGSIVASGGTSAYTGGRRVNRPEGQPDC